MDPQGDVYKWTSQLSIIFSHEILHLWVPNALKLEGDYDWFFEGFTMYLAVRTVLEFKVIKFESFLDTLARVYDSYNSQPGSLSLVDASEARWTNPAASVYVKGMLVAFLYDLTLRKETGGRTTLASRYRELFNGGVSDHANGNEAIIRWLASSPSLTDFTKSYIEDVKVIKLDEVLPAFGLQIESGPKGSKLKVVREPNDEQKRLLQSLRFSS